MIRTLTTTAIAALVLAACSPAPAEKTATAATPAAAPSPPKAPALPALPDLPAGAYKLDPSHASLSVRLSHLGFSFYTAQFKAFDATLQLDPANPGAASLKASIDPKSLDLPTPPAGFKTELLGPQWLDAGAHPTVTFTSTKVEPTGADTARITGDLQLRGVTKPMVLEAKFNGGYAGHPMDPHARIGFSAHGTFDRADHGMTYGIPAPGTKMGVGDAVEVVIETEFTGPAWTAPKP